MPHLKTNTCNHCHKPTNTGYIDGLPAASNPHPTTTQWAHIWQALNHTVWEATTPTQPLWQWQGQPTRHHLLTQHICHITPPESMAGVTPTVEDMAGVTPPF